MTSFRLWLLVPITVTAAASIVHATERQPATSALPDIFGSCYASIPMDCPVPRGEKWQAMYRERCTATPAQCTFRPDGTIARWVDKYEPGWSIRQAIEQGNVLREAAAP